MSGDPLVFHLRVPTDPVMADTVRALAAWVAAYAGYRDDEADGLAAVVARMIRSVMAASRGSDGSIDIRFQVTGATFEVTARYTGMALAIVEWDGIAGMECGEVGPWRFCRLTCRRPSPA